MFTANFADDQDPARRTNPTGLDLPLDQDS